MNNLVYFKGVLRGVTTKTVQKGNSSLSRIEIDVQEFYFDPVEQVKYPSTNNYFLTRFNWKREKDFQLEKEYFFVCKASYKRVESKKVKYEDGTAFTYGTFDFVLVQAFKTKEEVKEYLIESLGLN